MTKRLVTILVVSVLAALLLTSFAFARASWDSQKLHEERAKKIQQFSFPDPNRPSENVSDRFSGLMGPNMASAARRSSVGAGVTNAAVVSPGFEFDATYDDWQGSPRGRKVDFWGTADIQFAYQDLQTADPNQDRTGYNVFDPVGPNWPRGVGIGCEIQASGDYGVITSAAVTPKGRIVMAGVEPLTQADNRFYFQSSTTAYSCTWGLGTTIPKTSYKTWRGNPADTAPELALPIIDIQIIGSDTITHVAARWQATIVRGGTNPALLSDYPWLYYNKKGQTQSGTWNGPTLIDTCWAYVSLASSRVNSKVAVCYERTTDQGYIQGQENDENLYYRESTDGGTTWGPRTGILSENRTVQSLGPWIEPGQALYDSNGDLHIVFNASIIDANPYTSGYVWNSLYRGSNMYHWYKPTNTLSLIYDATWPAASLPGDLCGWIGYNALTTAYMSVSECAGRIYAFWSMANDMNNPTAAHDDCTSGGAPNDWRFYANAELWMSVSNDLTGLLWDAPRNITNSYTPNCDSATGGGVCMNDVKLAVSRYGMDSSSYGTTLSWPAGSSITGGGTPTNDSMIHMFYVEDHYPGQWDLKSASLDFVGTLNPLKYMRLSCVAPVTAPRIKVSPTLLGYPSFVKYGQTKANTITVQNQGNASLVIANNEVVKTNYTAQAWLTVSTPTLTLPPATNGTFDVNIVATPFFTAGTIYSLNGQVKVHNNVPTLDSVKIIDIVNYLIADTVVGLVWDTVSTACTKLTISSTGEMGHLGASRVNLDYIGSGTDCSDSANFVNRDVYLYSGGPMVIKNTGGGNYVFSSALFQGDFTTTQAFKNISGGVPTHGSKPAYDSFYTANMVNRDTSIVLNRTYWAPKQADSCPFVIVRTRYTAKTSAQANVLISEIVDWDVPGVGGSDNKTGISAKGFVYQRGTDTTARVCTDSARWAATALLGYYAKSELVGDACTNHDVPYGAYAQLNDSVFKYDTTAENTEAGYFWNKATAGFVATTFNADHHSALTVVKGQTISPTDTFVVYTVVTSVKQGTLADLETNFTKAKCWYTTHLRSCTCGCCVGSTGNVDCDASDGVDIGDLTALIDNLFITFTPLCCEGEANCDGGGGVDIGDLTALIDNLFITFTPLAACQ